MPTTSTDKPHAGRVALVTGAARGIGQAIAVGLARQGATVVIGDVEDLTETSKLIASTGESAVAATLDISDPSVIDQVRVRVADRASKMGVIGLTRALSATLGDDGITINAVLPSLTHTAMTENLPAAVVNASLGRQVIHRMAEPEDIAGSVLILAAEGRRLDHRPNDHGQRRQLVRLVRTLWGTSPALPLRCDARRSRSVPWPWHRNARPRSARQADMTRASRHTG
jgi:NAD(P)-dependent dehydrogenase (short-subunit alcohol dehydrogenase family)